MTTPYPKHVMIELTDRCNLKCMICVREEYEKGIGGPGVLMDIDNLAKLETPISHAKIITVTGFGETFLHPRFEECLRYIYSINPSDNLIKIVTNGTALNAKKAKWFSGHLNSISISLNASNAEAYAREMHPYEYAAGKDTSGKFDRLLERICDFADALKPEERGKVHLHYVVHRDNIKDVVDFVRLAHKMRLSVVNFTHFMIHRAHDIEKSIYWYKDEYNDAIDEAIEVGRALGVGVGARRFFTEQQRTFVPERDCTWPHDTTIIGTSGNVTPCCYWRHTPECPPANVFAGGKDEFDKIWFGEYYRKLRKKRIGPACSTCNILRTFDDLTIHFSPRLKGMQEFKEKLAYYQSMTESEVAQLNNRFDQAALDMALHRRTLRETGIDYGCLLDVQVEADDPLKAVESRIWEEFRKAGRPASSNLSIDLSGRFLGTGWGPAGSNQHGQVWRWMGGHRGRVSVFMRLEPHSSYDVEFLVYSATTTEGLTNINVSVNGFETEAQRLYRKNDLYYFSCVIPVDAVDKYSGHVWLSIGTGDPGNDNFGSPELSFTSLSVTDRKSSDLEYEIASMDSRSMRRTVGSALPAFHSLRAAASAFSRSVSARVRR